MSENTAPTVVLPVPVRDVLTEILRQEAQQMLAQAIDVELAEWLAAHRYLVDTIRPTTGRK